MDRETALKLADEKVKNKRLIKHMLAVEAIMRALARRFGQDEETWGLAGLLHDLDYDETVKDFANHGKRTAEWLDGKVGPDILHAIEAHPGHVPRESLMDKALYAADPLTGLVVAAALINPAKKLGAIDAEFVLKRFDEKRFAAGANRDQIRTCGEMGLSLEEFVDIGVKAMQAVSAELGL